MFKIKKVSVITILFSAFLVISCKEAPIKSKLINSSLIPVDFSFSEVSGIGFEKGITRRDPSDIIKIDSMYYIYYTKVIGKASGYWGDLWYATSNDKGYTWKEEGQILGVGKKGNFDSQAVFTPNIISSKGKYYLFYTGVKPTPGRTDGVFENNSTTDITALGLAIADSPYGPFKRFGKPILEISAVPDKFDSYRIDDAALLHQNGKYLLYYKGRSRKHNEAGPKHTQMGVAVADKPEGPYVKHQTPVLDKSHEVMIWRQGDGVATLASISSTLEYSKTGFDFITDKKSIKVENRPFAPGAYRADLTGGEANTLDWGISMIHNGSDCYLIRYDVSKKDPNAQRFKKGTFGYDKRFLKRYYRNTIVLESDADSSGIIISPELQGRIMTSTLGGDKGLSFGWINHDLIASKKINSQFNAFGGEERFWLGPEGGQFALYFPENASFDFENWRVPSVIDTEPFEMVSQDDMSVSFHKQTELTNRSGFRFSLDIVRTVSLLSEKSITANLGLGDINYSSVAYETKNTLKNIGGNSWSGETGAISIWMLCMLNPSPEVAIVAPIKQGSKIILGPAVNDDYFGEIGKDRLVSTKSAVFFKADGKSRGKIGISPKRAIKYVGSYDAENTVLTILEIDPPDSKDNYVNSAWEIQKNPFSGDVINAYNDGPLEDGNQLGPFYELESSSPALLLKPNESYTHTQRMYHFKGDKSVIDSISQKLLGVSLKQIRNGLK